LFQSTPYLEREGDHFLNYWHTPQAKALGFLSGITHERTPFVSLSSFLILSKIKDFAKFQLLFIWKIFYVFQISNILCWFWKQNLKEIFFSSFDKLNLSQKIYRPYVLSWSILKEDWNFLVA
jgi:hypothetical protein